MNYDPNKRAGPQVSVESSCSRTPNRNPRTPPLNSPEKSMTYRKDYRELEREYFWTLPRVLVAASVAIILSIIILRPLLLLSNVLNPENVITSYERFHDLNQKFAARKSQVTAFKALPPDANTRIDLLSIQQSCRDIVAQYNADASKVNKSLFRGHSLPEVLDTASCN